MQYLVNYLTCLLLLLFVASTSSTSSGPKSIRKSAHNSTKHDRGWWSTALSLKCGEHIFRMGRRLQKSAGKNRMINGIQVHPGQFPYAVRIFAHYNIGWYRYHISECGGVIIADRWIVTAAHCIQKWDSERSVSITAIVDSVTIGDYSIKDKNDGGRMLEVDRYYIHPEFNSSHPDYDIALLRTSETMEFELNAKNGGYGAVNSACLPTKEVEYTFKNSREVWYVAGWGKTEKNVEPDTMLYNQVSLVDYSYCKSSYMLLNETFNPDRTFCTFNEGRGVNYGDSGSGVVRILGDGRYELVGIVSSMVRLRRDKRGPDLYTNIFNYMRWIRSYTDGFFADWNGHDELRRYSKGCTNDVGLPLNESERVKNRSKASN